YERRFISDNSGQRATALRQRAGRDSDSAGDAAGASQRQRAEAVLDEVAGARDGPGQREAQVASHDTGSRQVDGVVYGAGHRVASDRATIEYQRSWTEGGI